jgi:hypothetical protein
MLRWAGARGWVTEAAVAQAALDGVAERLLRGHVTSGSARSAG